MRAVVITALLALGVSACGDGDGSGAGTATSDAPSDARPAGDLTVGFSNKAADQFVLTMQNFAVEQIEEAGMKGLQPVSAGTDPAKQISDVQSLVSAGADAMIVVPQDSSAIKPALDFLASRDIPTVTLDTAPVGARVAMAVMADNVGMGEDACKQMGEWLRGRGTVLSMQGDYRTSTGRDRGVGFKDCMDAEFPDIEVIERPTYWDAARAADVANTTLKTNEDIDGVYMASDTVMLSPVLSALKSAGRDAGVGEPGHVHLISIDGSPFGLEQIRAGRLDALLSQPLDLYAKYGVEYLRRASAGETFSEGPTEHDSRIVTISGNLTDLLPAPLVTAENASDASLWGNAG
jgi:ABC-type sugar transport system substrate-binding protein